MSFLDRLHPLYRTPGDREPNIAYFVARLGGAGELWAEEYTLPPHVELMSTTDQALAALRSRRLAAGRADLAAAAAMLHATAGATRSVHLLLARWYHQALAYLRYREDDFRGADRALDEAEEAVREAIDLQPFLLPYAMRCYECWCHRIRVARGEREWGEMWRRVEIAGRIVEGELPCCVPRPGKAVDVAAVAAFYRQFAGLTPRELQPLQIVIDADARRAQFRAVLADVYCPPGFVIPYEAAPAAAAGSRGVGRAASA